MTKEMLDRWIEVQFFIICNDLLNLRNSIPDVMETVDALSFINNYNTLQLKELVNKTLGDRTIEPTKEEFVILAHGFGVAYKEIKRRCRLHNKTLYSLYAQHEKNPRYFYPRFNTQELKVAQQFINAFETMKGIGL